MGTEMPAPFSSLIDSSVLNLESEKKARRLIARRPVTALRTDRVVLNLVKSRVGLHVVERLAIGEPGALCRFDYESKRVNRLLSDSASVGWARIASRKTV
jgi:hypothetical protein